MSTPTQSRISFLATSSLLLQQPMILFLSYMNTTKNCCVFLVEASITDNSGHGMKCNNRTQTTPIGPESYILVTTGES